MKVCDIKPSVNDDAIAMLKDAIRDVEAGKISQVSIAWVTSDGGLGGDISNAKNNIMAWAAVVSLEKQAYRVLIETS